MRGNLRKMSASVDDKVRYSVTLSDQTLELSNFIGGRVSLNFTGNIFCCHCQSPTKKSYSQGYCFNCFQTLAQTDSCIMSPEKCHYVQGTCRDNQWAESHCLVDHFVYLSNTSGLKIGITRGSQIPTRWIDQGAVQAVTAYRVSERRLAGLIESQAKAFMADRTNWRAMLKNETYDIDLVEARNDLHQKLSSYVEDLRFAFGINAITETSDSLWTAEYPVIEYPSKVVSLNAEKTPLVEGRLMGIKGQYLILDTGVINLRKYTGYEVELVATKDAV